MSEPPVERQLPADIEARVVELGERADEAEAKGDFVLCKNLLLEGFALLPEPKYEWAVGEVLLCGAADAALRAGDPAAALSMLKDGLEAPVMNSPPVNLRIGRALFELGRKQESTQHFLFALLGGGSELFDDQDDKYHDFACEELRPPEGCESWDDYEPPDEWPPDDGELGDFFELEPRQPEPGRAGLTGFGKLIVAAGVLLLAVWLVHSCIQ
ncbi:MAG TPA: hypothetical protein VM686_26000 [Polyangiaceae bacterium]|nr:hypothetical protein [Polyangiaceae bacterium]